MGSTTTCTPTRVKPRVIPGSSLDGAPFSEGSIGGDIERVTLDQLEAFYGDSAGGSAPAADWHREPTEPSGSNGFAIAPASTPAATRCS